MRTIKDANLRKLLNLPAAAGTAYTPSIKLGTGPHTEILEGLIKLPATPSLVDAKTVTLTLQDSADDITFNDVVPVAPLVVTGDGGDGAAAAESNFRFPPTIRMFVRLKVEVLAAGGDNTDIQAEFAVLA